MQQQSKKYSNEVNSDVVVGEFFLSKGQIHDVFRSEYPSILFSFYYDLVRSYLTTRVIILSLSLVRWRQNLKGDFSTPFFNKCCKWHCIVQGFFFNKKTHDLMHRRSCIDGKKKSIVNPKRTKANHPMMLPGVGIMMCKHLLSQ